jgi:hypothetical protein
MIPSVDDTSPAARARYFELLRARSPEQRLRLVAEPVRERMAPDACGLALWGKGGQAPLFAQSDTAARREASVGRVGRRTG